MKKKSCLNSVLELIVCMGIVCVSQKISAQVSGFEELAQGDGDPTEELSPDFITDETSETKTNVEALETTEFTDDGVATITAEGDFLVPTYLLPVESNAQSEVVSAPITTTTTTTTTVTSEVIAAPGANLPVVAVSDGNIIAVSSEVAQGLLNETETAKTETVNATSDQSAESAAVVPSDLQASGEIENVSADNNLSQNTQSIETTTTKSVEKQTVRYIGSGNVNANPASARVVNENADIVKPEVTEVVQPASLTPSGRTSASILTQTETVQIVPTKPVLIPLAPYPETMETEPYIEAPQRKVVPSRYADELLGTLKNGERPQFIMPHEIKVSFYPNASEFSGQTIKWIKAFSASALADPKTIVQVRLSKQNPYLQSKRLAIVKNALIGSGLSTHQIQIVYTDRPADSLVLRVIENLKNTEVTVRKTGQGRRVEKRIIKW